MASKLALLAKMADFKDFTSGFTKDEEAKEPPSEKQLKADEKEKLAREQAELDRKKRHQKEEYQREKVRENMRQKYGIAKPAQKGGGKVAAVEEVAKDYGLDEETTKELNSRILKDEEEREKSRNKIDKKLDKRRQKKELKEKCQVQWASKGSLNDTAILKEFFVRLP